MDGSIQDVKLARKDIDIGAVSTVIRKKDPNRILGTAFPEINEDENEIGLQLNAEIFLEQDRAQCI